MNALNELNEAAEQVKKKQQEELVIDFDKAVEKRPPIVVRFEGQEFEIAQDPPAKVGMFIVRKGNALSDNDTIELLRLIFGDDFISALESSDAAFADVVISILVPVMEKWGFKGNEFIEEEKKTEAIPDS